MNGWLKSFTGGTVSRRIQSTLSTEYAEFFDHIETAAQLRNGHADHLTERVTAVTGNMVNYLISTYGTCSPRLRQVFDRPGLNLKVIHEMVMKVLSTSHLTLVKLRSRLAQETEWGPEVEEWVGQGLALLPEAEPTLGEDSWLHEVRTQDLAACYHEEGPTFVVDEGSLGSLRESTQKQENRDRKARKKAADILAEEHMGGILAALLEMNGVNLGGLARLSDRADWEDKQLLEEVAQKATTLWATTGIDKFRGALRPLLTIKIDEAMETLRARQRPTEEEKDSLVRSGCDFVLDRAVAAEENNIDVPGIEAAARDYLRTVAENVSARLITAAASVAAKAVALIHKHLCKWDCFTEDRSLRQCLGNVGERSREESEHGAVGSETGARFHSDQGAYFGLLAGLLAVLEQGSFAQEQTRDPSTLTLLPIIGTLRIRDGRPDWDYKFLFQEAPKVWHDSWRHFLRASHATLGNHDGTAAEDLKLSFLRQKFSGRFDIEGFGHMLALRERHRKNMTEETVNGMQARHHNWTKLLKKVDPLRPPQSMQWVDGKIHGETSLWGRSAMAVIDSLMFASPRAVYTVDFRRPKWGDGLSAYRLAHEGIPERIRALGYEGEQLAQAVAYAQPRAADLQRACPLHELLPEHLKKPDAPGELLLGDAATNLGRKFFVPEGRLARSLMHVTNVHEVLYHTRASGDHPSSLWNQMHKQWRPDQTEVLGSAASFELLERYMEDEKAKILRTERLHQTAEQTEQQAWRRGKLRREREIANFGYLPNRVRNLGVWYDGDEGPIPKHVISIDPGSRSVLTARSFVESTVNEEPVTTTNKATLTASASKRTRTRNIKRLQRIRAKTSPAPPNVEHLERVDRVASTKYINRASWNALQQQRYYGAVCRGLRALLNRPTLSRHPNGQLFVKAADSQDINRPGRNDEVILLMGASTSRHTAEAQGLILKIHEAFPHWKIRWVNEWLSSQVCAEGHLIGMSHCLSSHFAKMLTFVLPLPDPNPKRDAQGGVILPPLLDVREISQGNGPPRKIHSLQAATAKDAQGNKKTLVVDRDAHSCIAIHTIANHPRDYDAHPWRPPFGMKKGDIPDRGVRRAAEGGPGPAPPAQRLRMGIGAQ